MRDNKWLENKLQLLLTNHFSDVVVTNPIEIRFGREAKYRFGSIKLYKTGARRFRGFRGQVRGLRRLGESKVPQKSIITITSMFTDESIPEKVVEYTIAHELCHYAHGFSSANRQLFRYPHHGGIVNRELKKRGADELVRHFREWLSIYRKKILDIKSI